MLNNKKLMHCRVCGLKQEEPPWGEDGKSPTYDYCACCGVEFGYGDAMVDACRRWRKKWIEGGAKWSEPDKMPSKWSFHEQIREVPRIFR